MFYKFDNLVEFNLQNVIEKDAEFLGSNGLLDYSLLIAIEESSCEMTPK